jgi:zinc protease
MTHKIKTIVSIIIGVMAVNSTNYSYASTSNNTHETTLDNGLKIIVKEDHRAPVIISEIWYKVGASYEHNGITGISHMLEHMMFKATKNLKDGEFTELIARKGGQQNAFTSNDYTGYYQLLSKEHLDTSFYLEAERMQNLLLDPAILAKELQVVTEKRRKRKISRTRKSCEFI